MCRLKTAGGLSTRQFFYCFSSSAFKMQILIDLRALFFVSPISTRSPQFSSNNSNQFDFNLEKGRRYPTTPPLVDSRNPAAGDPQRNAGSNNPESNGLSYAQAYYMQR